MFNRNTGQAFTGDVAELLIYSTALSSEDNNKVGVYLQQKYALSSKFLSPNFPDTSLTTLPATVPFIVPLKVITYLYVFGVPEYLQILPAHTQPWILDTSTQNAKGSMRLKGCQSPPDLIKW